MKFNIYGDYVDGEPYGDEIAPSKFRAATAALKKGEPLELHVNSLGGSVTSGIAIANTIRELSKAGHRTTCVVEGVAASIASITAMACDEIQMYPSAFLMIHNPWTMLMGDANALRKEADTLDKMRAALVSFYRSKFDRSDDEIVALMDAETWISGEEAVNYGLAVTLLADEAKSRAAAKATLKKLMARFHNSPINEETKKLMKDEDIEKKPDEETVEETKPAEEQPAPAEPQNPAEPTPDEEKKDAEEQTPDEPQKPEEEQPAPAEPTPDEEKKPDEDEPVEARLAKCQSVFQKKINDLKAEMSAQAKELQTAKASVSSLEASLEQSKAELAKAQAAAADAESRLATLSANALAHTDEKPTFADGLAKCKTPEERSRFIASGNYTR